MSAPSAVTRKRTDILKLMNDRENLLIVKNELTELDRLCQHFQDCYNALYHELRSEEDKEEVSAHFSFKESDIFEYRNKSLIG